MKFLNLFFFFCIWRNVLCHWLFFTVLLSCLSERPLTSISAACWLFPAWLCGRCWLAGWLQPERFTAERLLRANVLTASMFNRCSGSPIGHVTLSLWDAHWEGLQTFSQWASQPVAMVTSACLCPASPRQLLPVTFDLCVHWLTSCLFFLFLLPGWIAPHLPPPPPLLLFYIFCSLHVSVHFLFTFHLSSTPPFCFSLFFSLLFPSCTSPLLFFTCF